jgi:polyphosphate kinase 2 (PPK2 family)
LALEALQKGIERVSTRREDGVRHHRDYKEKDYILQNIDMSPVLDRDSYKEKLEDLQLKSNDVMLRLRKAGIPVILAFEGVDAAGKDGAIKRLIKEMDPRAYTIHPISAPDETEHKHHYLWRFYKRFHRKAHLDIFSRSWYGRVMVERIEGFATENEWERAYDEMLRMEKDMADEGAMILKFFVTIDKDTQLDRFQARENDEDKQFKITEEDWRNRGRWDDYIEAMNEMLVRTDVPYAPWIVVPGNDKYYARIFVMEAFIKQAEKILAKEKAD